MATTDRNGIFVSEETDEITPFHTYLNTAMATVSHVLDNVLPVGVILPFAGTVAPSGWELCHGGSVPVAEYPELFDLIGYSYGGEDDVFGVPDMRTRVPVGYDVRNAPFNTIGAKGGAKEVTLTQAQLPPHSHAQRVTAAVEGGNSGGLRRDFIQNSSSSSFKSFKAYSQWVNTVNTGARQPHNNLQPYIVLEYIIKLK